MKLTLSLFCFLGSIPAFAQGIITTMAGTSTIPSAGYSGDGGPATSAQLYNPQGAVVDAAGNIYFSDAVNFRIRKVSTNGVITTIAGNGVRGTSGDGGPALSASLGFISQMAFSNNGQLCFGDGDAYKIRCISLALGMIQGYGTGTPGYGGDGGPVGSATFYSIQGMAFDAAGNMYISDFANNRIRKVDAATGIINAFAGTGFGYSGIPLNDNGPALSANIYQPWGLQVANGALYIVDAGNARIRKVDLVTNIITTVAGDGTYYNLGEGVPATSTGASARSIAIDPLTGNIFFHGPTVRMVDSNGLVRTVAGNGNSSIGQDDIPGPQTTFAGLTGLGWDPFAKRLLISDGGNNRVRQIYFTPATTVSLTPPSNPSPTPVTLQAVVTPVTATGVVRYYNGSILLGSAPVNAGTATFSWAATLGTYNVRAVYGGDPANNLSQSATVPVTVKNGSTTVLIKNTPEPMLNSPVTFTAFVNGSGTPPTGTVEFRDNGVSLGTSAVASGQAVLQASFTLGQHAITAFYSGDTNTIASNSPVMNFNVRSALGFTFYTTPNPSTVGQTVSFIATPTASQATGTVTFRDNGVAFGSAPLVNGVATLTSAVLTAGMHNISLLYSGDNNYLDASTSSITHTVKVNTTTTVTSNANPSAVGQAVTFSVSVTPATVTGLALIYDGTTPIATLTLTNGTATYTTSTLTAGAHAIKAYYGSDALNNESTSAVITQTVRLATATTLTTSRNPANRGQNVTFTARVNPTAAAGRIEFYDGTTLLASRTLSNGVATFATSSLSTGTHSIQARYVGSTTYAPSNSTALSQVIR
jgi:large repetitive protein